MLVGVGDELAKLDVLVPFCANWVLVLAKLWYSLEYCGPRRGHEKMLLYVSSEIIRVKP
jgi:hypothetical protein